LGQALTTFCLVFYLVSWRRYTLLFQRQGIWWVVAVSIDFSDAFWCDKETPFAIALKTAERRQQFRSSIENFARELLITPNRKIITELILFVARISKIDSPILHI